MEKISKISFGKICTGITLSNAIKQDETIRKEADSIKRLIRKNNLHKTKYTDVILHYDKYNGIHGIISSKKQGIPMNPFYRSNQITKNTLDDFKSWLLGWDDAYSPKTLAYMKKIQNKALQILRKKS